MTIMDFIKHIPAVAIGLWVVEHVFGQPDRPPLEFHVDDAAEHYRQFIEDLRERLGSGNTIHGIRILRIPATVPSNRRDRYLLVHLSNEDNFQITVALDVTDAYLIGYRAGNRSYFFDEYYNTARTVIFTDAVPHRIPFGSNYNHIEHDMVFGAQNRAGSSSQRIINRPSTSRADVDLGLVPLQAAIASLFRYDRRSLASSLLVIVQMIAEAARFTYIERRVIRSIQNHESFRPDDCMRTLENNWNPLSEGVQRANSSGEFVRTDHLQLITPNGQIYLARRVTEAILAQFGLVLVKYLPRGPRRHNGL